MIEDKCTLCGDLAEYKKLVDGEAIYYCWHCAEKAHGVITLWNKKCWHCGEWLSPGGIVAMYNPEQDEWYSYCSTDCAMRELGYAVLDDEEQEDER